MFLKRGLESKEFKIKRYHSNEIKLILFICATDLTNYDKEDLKIFVECIEGRIEILFTSDFLKSINQFINVDKIVLKKLIEFKTIIQKKYSSQWYNKMKDLNWIEVIKLSQEIIEILGLEYQEPLFFMENNLEIDWT